jgi:hypothetical protein
MAEVGTKETGSVLEPGGVFSAWPAEFATDRRALSRYILALAADPNWPTEGFVPRPGALEQEVAGYLKAPMILEAQPRAYNPSASSACFFRLEVSSAVPAAGIKNAFVQVLDRQKDRAFRGVPVRVILYNAEGGVVSQGTAYPGRY